MLFSLLKHYLELYITDTAQIVSRSLYFLLLLYIMVLKTISPGCGVRASLMLFFAYCISQSDGYFGLAFPTLLPLVERFLMLMSSVGKLYQLAAPYFPGYLHWEVSFSGTEISLILKNQMAPWIFL